jgi:hypothetical protein
MDERVIQSPICGKGLFDELRNAGQGKGGEN